MSLWTFLVNGQKLVYDDEAERWQSDPDDLALLVTTVIEDDGNYYPTTAEWLLGMLEDAFPTWDIALVDQPVELETDPPLDTDTP